MTSEDIAQKLRTFSPPKHTFTVQTHGDITILDDTHNASPESFKAGIAWARTQPAERKILLTSGLIELGETQDRVHMEIGALAAEVFDVVHCLSDRSAPALARGYGKAIAPLSQEPLTPGTLLVCVGCINPAIIKRLLP
jgi:UDP-N-acetylmuramoyl-tripeptide--D-alanyl-D-alanine ligase